VAEIFINFLDCYNKVIIFSKSNQTIDAVQLFSCSIIVGEHGEN